MTCHLQEWLQRSSPHVQRRVQEPQVSIPGTEQGASFIRAGNCSWSGNKRAVKTAGERNQGLSLKAVPQAPCWCARAWSELWGQLCPEPELCTVPKILSPARMHWPLNLPLKSPTPFEHPPKILRACHILCSPLQQALPHT